VLEKLSVSYLKSLFECLFGGIKSRRRTIFHWWLVSKLAMRVIKAGADFITILM